MAAFQLKRQARPWCAQLQAVSPELTALSAEIEQRFLSCGQALRQQVELTGRLAVAGARLGEVGSTPRSGTALGRLGQLIGAHLALSDDFAAEIERLASSLDQHSAELERLRRDQQHLERSFAPMQFLQSYFRIEAATLPAELHALFDAVTTEMQRLHADVTASFAQHAEALERTRGRALAAGAQLHAEAARVRSRTSEKRASVATAVARLDSELTAAAERNRRLDDAIRELNRDTDAITFSLQFQDITRQKIEHVQAAAATVLEKLTQPDARRALACAREQQLLCEVQTVQLATVQDELDRAGNTIAAGLRGLHDRLESIERECLSVQNVHEITAGMHGATTAMLDAHHVSAELLCESFGSLHSAIETAREFAHATHGATDTMRRLASDLLVMGLNAQVQAVRANNGCLEALSSATATLSSEAGGLTLAFERQLSQTTEALTGLVHHSEEVHASIHARCRELEAENRTIGSASQQEEAATAELAGEVAGILDQLKGQTEHLLASVDLASFSREPIARARAIFESLAGVAARVAAAVTPADEALLNVIQERYTMNSEREAHAAALARGRGAPPVAAASVTAALAAPAATTSVATPIPNPDSSAPVAPPPATPPPDISPPTALGPAEPATAASPATGDGLGDNVELF